MVDFTDFTNGLNGADDYLSAQNSINGDLTGSVADVGKLIIKAEYDFTLKEIICSLLAGRGLLLPNIQVCVSLNLKEILNFVGAIQGSLYNALAELDQKFDAFLDHLKIDQVLGRINGVIAEVQSIANMINFCSTPIDPIQIPNVLENAMESFLGKGKELVDRIGTMLPENINGCLIPGGFNTGVFATGILKTISDNWTAVISGTLDQTVLESLTGEIQAISLDIDSLIARETGAAATYSIGGSDFTENGARETNLGLGTLFNSNDEGVGGATQYAAQIWGAYQQLGSYQVTDADGNVHNNIFELFVDDDLLRLLRRESNPTPEIAAQIPVYNYCGEVVGYTAAVAQADSNTSVGEVPSDIIQPGYNAGGLSTDPADITDVAPGTTGDTIINTTLNVDPTVSNTTTTTTDDTAVEVFWADDTRIALPTNTTWFFTCTAVGRRTDVPDYITFKIQGMADDRSGVLSLSLAAADIFHATTDNSEYNMFIDVVDNQMRVRVQGDNGHTVNWTLEFDYLAAS